MTATTSPYPVIYAFGDSLSDAGDAYLLSSSAVGQADGLMPEPVSPPYYAATYTAQGGGTLTADVFSNGPTWVQDLAADLGLATPGPGDVGTDIGFGYVTLVDGAANGTDFAIGGSVTGPTDENTSDTVALTDLSAQITNFQQAGSAVAGALYTVWSGSNDLLNLLSDSNFATLSANGMAAADVMQSVTNEVNAVQTLIGYGAQSVLVVNVPDLGKIPAITAKGATASAAATQLAQQFNTDLASALGAASFGAATVRELDAFSLIDNAIANPSAYGLTDVTDPVYTGSYTIDNPPPAVTGEAQDDYLFFDQMHPTETGHEAIASAALQVLDVTCFVAGTRIATPEGERAVEALAAGDLVLTASGRARPIRWIGRRSFAGRFFRANARVWPIRFRAGSLGAGLPRRDLLVSPEHAMFLDGVLIPARCLVDGVTVAPERGLARVDYLHIELDSHDAVLAEGAAAETFLDDDSRGMFQNAAEHAARFPGAARGGEFCAPRVEHGAVLDRVRARLAASRAA